MATMTIKEKRKNLINDDDPAFSKLLPSINEFILADIASDTLNEIITYAARERIREGEKPHPNLQYMDEMKKLREEASDMAHNPKNFATRESMITIIQKYAVMSREFSEKEQI